MLKVSDAAILLMMEIGRNLRPFLLWQ